MALWLEEDEIPDCKFKEGEVWESSDNSKWTIVQIGQATMVAKSDHNSTCQIGIVGDYIDFNKEVQCLIKRCEDIK